MFPCPPSNLLPLCPGHTDRGGWEVWLARRGGVWWSCDTVQNVTATSAGQSPESWRQALASMFALWWSINNVIVESSVNLRRAEEEGGEKGAQVGATQVVVGLKEGMGGEGGLGCLSEAGWGLWAAVSTLAWISGSANVCAASLYIKTQSHGTFTLPWTRTISSSGPPPSLEPLPPPPSTTPLPRLLTWTLQTAQLSVVRSQEHPAGSVHWVKAVNLRVGQDRP